VRGRPTSPPPSLRHCVWLPSAVRPDRRSEERSEAPRWATSTGPEGRQHERFRFARRKRTCADPQSVPSELVPCRRQRLPTETLASA
jgi:hypothetical protein